MALEYTLCTVCQGSQLWSGGCKVMERLAVSKQDAQKFDVGGQNLGMLNWARG
jgi:hypothetical protein